MALTKRQKEFLEFLAGFLEKRGYSPSYEEIAEGLDLASLATVHKARLKWLNAGSTPPTPCWRKAGIGC